MRSVLLLLLQISVAWTLQLCSDRVDLPPVKGIWLASINVRDLDITSGMNITFSEPVKQFLLLNRSTYNGESWLLDKQFARIAASRIDESTFFIEKTHSARNRSVTSVLFMLEYDEKVLMELVSINIGDKVVCGFSCEYGRHPGFVNTFIGCKITHEDWPWVAALYSKGRGSYEYICGGSLISRRHVLTAAHCIPGPFWQYWVQLGTLYIDECNSDCKMYSVRNKTIHWIYEEANEMQRQIRDHDIGILTLEQEVKPTNFICPVKLWHGALREYTHSQARALGFGAIDSSKFSVDLKEVEVEILDNLKCCKLVNVQRLCLILSNNTLCAKSVNNSVMCHGDSGHGVVVSVKQSDRTEWMLRGITSKSYAISRNSSYKEYDTSKPSVLTDIDVFRQWVNDHISQDFGRLNSEKIEEEFKRILFYENADSFFQTKNNLDIIFKLLVLQNFEDLKKYWQLKDQTPNIDWTSPSKLQERLDPDTFCSIFEFSQLHKEKKLEAFCTEFLRQNAMLILRSDNLTRCQLSTLEIMVSEDNFTSCVSELDLFNACVKWAENLDQPRRALGDVLRYIRFGTLTYQEFVTHVLPSNLLNDAEVTSIELCIRSCTCNLPPGLSNETSSRYNMEKLKEREEYIEFHHKDVKFITPADIAEHLMRISTKRAVWVLGVRLIAYREDIKRPGEEYHQTVEVLLRRRDITVLATVTYNGSVREFSGYAVRFERPYLLAADTEYQIQVKFHLSDSRHWCYERPQQTEKAESDVEVRLLENVWTPVLHLILSDYKC